MAEACASPCCAPTAPPKLCSRRNLHVSGQRSPRRAAGPWQPLRRWTTRAGRPARRPRRISGRAKSPRAASADSRWAARCHDLDRSGGQTGATLATASRENRAPARVRIRSRKPWVFARRFVVRLEGALAHSGAPERIGVGGVPSLAVTVRPHSSRYARVHRFSITLHVTCAHRRPGGSSHRQLDLVTVRGTAPFGQTSRPVDTVHRLGTTTESLPATLTTVAGPDSFLYPCPHSEVHPDPIPESHLRGLVRERAPVADVPADLAAVVATLLEQLLEEGRGQGVESKDEHWIRRCPAPRTGRRHRSARRTERDLRKAYWRGRLAPSSARP